MNSPNPAADGGPVDPAPKPTRRTFTAEYRNRILDEYRGAPHGEKSAVLRREGLYQSQIREWAQAREAKKSSSSVRKSLLSNGDADGRAARREMERLTRENARLAKALTQTEAALEIMGKLHVLLESISESTGTPPRPSTPVHADIADIDAIFIDGFDDNANTIGVKGLGELGICGSAAAVANAVFNATGARIREFPITIDRLLPLLPDSGSG